MSIELAKRFHPRTERCNKNERPARKALAPAPVCVVREMPELVPTLSSFLKYNTPATQCLWISYIHVVAHAPAVVIDDGPAGALPDLDPEFVDPTAAGELAVGGGEQKAVAAGTVHSATAFV